MHDRQLNSKESEQKIFPALQVQELTIFFQFIFEQATPNDPLKKDKTVTVECFLAPSAIFHCTILSCLGVMLE